MMPSNQMLKNIKETLFLQAYSLFKIPLIFFLSPKVIELTEHKVRIRIPLSRRAKNHLNSCILEHCALGLTALEAYWP